MTTVDVEIPTVGESVSEVEITRWAKSTGDAVSRDETVLVVDSDKASVEIPAPVDGVLAERLHEEGDMVAPGTVVARIREGAEADGEEEPEAARGEEAEPAAEERSRRKAKRSERSKEPARTKARERRKKEKKKEEQKDEEDEREGEREQAEREERTAEESEREEAREEAERERPDRDEHDEHDEHDERDERGTSDEREPREEPAEGERADEDVVPMTGLRRTIARRLVAAQQEAALLTTFNEIDMTAVQQARTRLGQDFRDRHDVRLGLMPFFVRAVTIALREVPRLNARIRDDDIVHHRRAHVGVAIGGGEGLVVPVLRDADRMTFDEIEQAIEDFARKARDGTLEPDDLQGGTFTISNGGVYGSLLSTPIVNPPQSGVLGLHAIQERPVGREGQIVLRPMMYVALTYDHRIADGREAVTFLRRVKEMVEDPLRVLVGC